MQWQITPDKQLTIEEVECLFSRLETVSRTGVEKWIKCWAVTRFTFATGARVSEVAHMYSTSTVPQKSSIGDMGLKQRDRWSRQKQGPTHLTKRFLPLSF